MDVTTVVPPYVAKPLRLRPFRGLMLTPTLVGDPSALRAFARPYREVASRISSWIEQGRMDEDASEAVYVHEYTAGGLTVRGVVANLVVSPTTTDPDRGGIWPHEAVHRGQVDELADRMLEMRLNPAPILLVHQGSTGFAAWMGRTTARSPIRSFLDRSGQHHRIWAVHEPDEHAALARLMADADCLLADGHHRYAAYLDLQRRAPGTTWDEGLVMVVDQAVTPLHLGAIHRVLPDVRLDALREAATKAGAHTVELDRDKALKLLDDDHLLASDGERWLAVAPSQRGVSPLEWMQAELVPRLNCSGVRHHHDVSSALAQAGPAATAVLLPAMDHQAIRATLRASGVLPEKSTSFQPKPSLGVIMRRVPEQSS